MSNIEKAVEIIAEARRTAPRVRDMQDHISPHIAQALADAGLLAPDLPGPSMSKFDTYTVFARDEGSADGAYIDAKVETGSYQRGRITIDLDPSSGSDHGFTLIRSYVSPQWCRESAALLLAAANYAEEANR